MKSLIRRRVLSNIIHLIEHTLKKYASYVSLTLTFRTDDKTGVKSVRFNLYTPDIKYQYFDDDNKLECYLVDCIDPNFYHSRDLEELKESIKDAERQKQRAIETISSRKKNLRKELKKLKTKKENK